jgi:L-aminopeptidase/D-esterase-like protein
MITDVPGIRVGHATDAVGLTGVTVVLCDRPAVAGVELRGGANDVIGLDYLDSRHLVPTVNAVVLGGGSRFGGEAIWGVMRFLEERGVGFAVGPTVVPHVPGAFLFDLNVGNSRARPTREMGYEAAAHGAAGAIAEGNVGAGTGASVGKVFHRPRAMRGGLGTASVRIGDVVVGAIVAVNAVGSTTVGDSPHFWAAPFEQDGEFGERGLATPLPRDALGIRLKGGVRENTTIALVATDATLTKAQAKRLATVAHDGLARAIYPVHTPLDGDVVFAAATGAKPLAEPTFAFMRLGAMAANVVARAVARGVYAATALPFPGALPSWRDKFG